MRITPEEIKKDFERYLNLAIIGEQIIITKNGRDAAKIIVCEKDSFLSEEVASYCINQNRKVSYKEFIELTKNSDYRYELIDGDIYYLASPNFTHQKIIRKIIFSFCLWFEGKKCQPLTSPFDITLVKSKDNINVVQPDIVVICDTKNIDEEGKYHGVPTLVVEVLSKSTRRKDLVKKRNLYMQTGIIEYWIVDPDNKTVQVNNFNESNDNEYKTYKNNDTIASSYFAGLEIKVEDIFN